MPDKRATMAARKLRKIFGSPAGLSASPAGISASPAGIFFSPVAYLLDSRLDFGQSAEQSLDIFLIIFGDTSFLTPQAWMCCDLGLSHLYTKSRPLRCRSPAAAELSLQSCWAFAKKVYIFYISALSKGGKAAKPQILCRIVLQLLSFELLAKSSRDWANEEKLGSFWPKACELLAKSYLLLENNSKSSGKLLECDMRPWNHRYMEEYSHI